MTSFEEWKKEQDFPKQNSREYVNNELTPFDLLYVGDLLFPKVIEHSGCLFLEDHFTEDHFRTWHHELKGDLTAIESLINHVHVYDVFDKASLDTPEWVFEEAAQLLFRSWKMFFEASYPAWNIVVEYWSSEVEYGPTLSFYRKRE